MWLTVYSNWWQAELIPACKTPCVLTPRANQINRKTDRLGCFVGVCLYMQVHVNHCRTQGSASTYLSAYQVGYSHEVTLRAALLL